jgi:hypothetical protein
MGGFMPEILTRELKSDHEHIYKIAGDLLNEIDKRDFKDEKIGRASCRERVLRNV